MPHSPSEVPEQDLRRVYVFVVIVEALVVLSLVWLGRVFS